MNENEKQKKLFDTLELSEVNKIKNEDNADLVKSELVNLIFKIDKVKYINTKFGENVVIYIRDKNNDIHSLIGNKIIYEFLKENLINIDLETTKFTILKKMSKSDREYYYLKVI